MRDRQLAEWAERGPLALDERWDADFGFCLEYDIRADRPIRIEAVSGFAPLIAGGMTDQRRGAAMEHLPEIDFAEYVEPFTGEPLGSLNLSWTAAVALD